MNKTLLTLIFTALCFGKLSGQIIKTKVVSAEDSQSLPGATISIFTPDSIFKEAYSSDQKGLFSQRVPFDKFRIQISYLGYKDVNILIKNETSKDIDLGSTIMYADHSKMLKEVIVSAQSISDGVDRMVVLPSSQQIKASNSGIDLLQQLQLPGLFVDPVMQKVSIAGTSGVVYRINGVNSTLNQVIALKAEQIQRIEYSQNPSIREVDSNSGFINIFLKKELTGTYLNTNVLGAVATGFINGNANIKTIFNQSQLALDYDVNWRDYSKRWSRENESYYYPKGDILTLLKKGNEAPFGYLSHNINLTYTYTNTNDIFNIRFLNSIYNSFDRNYIDLYQYNTNDPLLFRNIHSKSNNYTPSIDVYYIKKIEDKKGFEVNLVGTLMNSDYKRTLRDTYYSNTPEDDIYNYIDGHKKSLIFESFYYNKKNPTNYNIGLKGIYSHVKNKYIGNTSRINQVNIYPYISVNGKIQNLSYTLGVGLQILHSKDDETSKNYYRNLSNLNVFYSKNKSWNIRNVLRYSPSFPSLSDLNDVDQKRDSLMIIRGNPYIKPAQTISNRLSYTYQIKQNIRMTIGINASKTFDPIRYNYYFDPSVSSFVSQRKNQDYEQNFGTTIDLNWNSIFKIFSASIGGGWDDYKSKGTNYSLHLNNFYWYIFCNAQFKNISINGGYRKASKDLYGQIISLNENYSSLDINYKKKNLNIKAGIMFPFTSGTKYGSELKSSVVQSNKYIYIRDNANMIYIGLSYNISWGRSMFKVNRNINNFDWDSGIMQIRDN